MVKCVAGAGIAVSVCCPSDLSDVYSGYNPPPPAHDHLQALHREKCVLLRQLVAYGFSPFRIPGMVLIKASIYTKHPVIVFKERIKRVPMLFPTLSAGAM